MKKSKELNGKVKCSKCGIYYIPRGGKAHCKEDVIPTAEEFFEEKYGIADRIFTRNAALLAKEFAKLHVEAALKAAAQKAQIHRKPTGEGESSEEYIAK